MNNENRFGILIFFSWSLLLMIVCAVINYNGLYSQDSHEYLRYSHEITAFLKTGNAPGNFFWPVNYPLIASILSFITGNILALQLLSIISAAWIIYLVVMFLIREFPGREREVSVFTVLFLGLSPYFFRYSISSMSDILATAFTCTAYYLLYLRFRTGKFRLMIFVLFFAGMAVCTRVAFIPFLIPVAFWSVFDLFKNRKYSLLFYSICLLLIPVVVYFYFKKEQSGEIFQHYLVGNWSVKNYFENSFSTPDGNSTYTLPNLLFVFSFLVHPGFLFPGALFIFLLCFKKNQPRLLYPLVLIGVVCYLLFIAGIPSRNTRYMIPVMPFFAITCFPAFMSVLAWLYKFGLWKNVIITGILVIQIVLVIRAFLPFYKINRVEQQVVDEVIDYHPPIIYTLGIEGALKSYGYKGEIVSLWNSPVTFVKEGSLLLFNKDKSEYQWKGKMPLRNFYFILDSAKAKKVETLESGWEIYKIHEAYPVADTGLPAIR